MPIEESDLTADQIVDVIESSPVTGLSDGSIHGLLFERGIETTLDEVREACESLVSRGRLEVIAQKGHSKRYRVIGGNDRADR